MAAFITPRALHEVNLNFGYCRCGCGEKTPLHLASDASKRWTGGQPMLYSPGHYLRRKSGFYAVEDRGYHTPCWIWQGGLSVKGYAMRKDVGRLHRAMYEDRHGPIPPGLEPDHLCCQKECINPDHLEPVTHTENVRRQKRTRLTIEDAREIRRRASGGESNVQIAASYGIFRASVYHIVTGKQWREELQEAA